VRWFFCATALLVVSAAVRADTIGFTLGVPNAGLSGFTGPYASVSVNRTSTTAATITFTSLTNGSIIYLMGDGNSVGVNVNGTFAANPTTPTSSNAGTGFSTTSSSEWNFNQGSNNVSEHGNFNFRWTAKDGYGHSMDTISFGVTLTSGSWLTANDVLVANGSGYRAVSHIFPAASPANANNNVYAGQTGYAAEGAVVPLPAAAWMGMSLLGGVGGVGFFRRRRLVEA
jgi:hypothetical protein